MELVEKINVRDIEYLNSLTYKQFKEYCHSGKNENARRNLFNGLKQFCKANLKTRGHTKRIYS